MNRLYLNTNLDTIYVCAVVFDLVIGILVSAAARNTFVDPECEEQEKYRVYQERDAGVYSVVDQRVLREAEFFRGVYLRTVHSDRNPPDQEFEA